MAIIENTGTELADKRGRLKYVVLDESSELVARALVNAYAPQIWAGLIKQDVQVTELGGDCWEADVPYSPLERQQQGDINWSFQIATQQIHITAALEHIATYPATEPDHDGAINVVDDGHDKVPKGCNVYVPVFSWDEEHFYPTALVTTHTFLRNLESLVATVNQDAFRVWPKGELLLLGAASTGSKNAGTDVGIRYRFASARTVTNGRIPQPTGIQYSKEGHQYLWPEYYKDASTGQLTNKIKALHVERVYEYGDWSSDLALPDWCT